MSVVAITIVAGFSVWGINTQSELVEKLYLHPLTVSTNVLEADTHLVAMHRYMKDVVIARDQASLNQAIALVSEHEAKVLTHLEVAKAQFLGDHQRFQQVIDAVIQWRAIRNEVIQLTVTQQYDQAASITLDAGAKYVSTLNKEMSGLVAFARAEAREFLHQSRAQKTQNQAVQTTVYVLVVIVVVLVFSFMYRVIRRSEKNITNSEYRYRSIYDNTPLSIWDEDFSKVYRKIDFYQKSGIKDFKAYLTDNPEVAVELAESVVVNRVNNASLKMFAAADEQSLIRSISKTFGKDAMSVFIDSMCALFEKQKLFTAKANYIGFDGRAIIGQISVPLPSSYQESHSVPVVIEDITHIKAHEEELERLAQFDSLTALPNRVLFSERLHQAMANTERSGHAIAVAFIDLDGFKAINDNYGHDIGDDLLVAVAKRMSASMREIDCLARIGGDEFVAIFSSIEDNGVLHLLLQRILDELSEPFHIDGFRLTVTASVGVTLYKQQQKVDGDQLQRQADQAMYEAKLAGRNTYRFFDPMHDSAISGKFALLTEIEEALAEEQFELHYQPKVHLETGKVIGAEALIRWNHPTKGLLYPAQFLPQIEQDYVSVQIGEWVIRRALRQINQWLEQDIVLPVSVNISPLQLQQDNFISRLQEMLARFPMVNASLLELEILETSSLENFDWAGEVVKRGNALGVKFALDDFGSGYSSLVYLKKLPVKILKIDQEFVRNMLSNPDDETILIGVLALANSFDMLALAEGVETSEHVDVLLSLGCEYGQGYAISKPLKQQDFIDWLATWRAESGWHKSAEAPSAQALEG